MKKWSVKHLLVKTDLFVILPGIELPQMILAKLIATDSVIAVLNEQSARPCQGKWRPLKKVLNGTRQCEIVDISDGGTLIGEMLTQMGLKVHTCD